MVSESLNLLPLDAKEYVHFPSSLTHLFLERLWNNSSHSLVYLSPPNYNPEDFLQYFQSKEIPAFSFPFYDLLPYEDGIPSPKIFIARLRTLFAIMEKTRGIYLVPLKSFLFGVPTPLVLKTELSACIRVGEDFSRNDWTSRLLSWQYTRVSHVEQPGEFSIKGELVEIWDPLRPAITRIHLDYDQVAKISPYPAPKGDFSQQNEIFHACQDFIYTPEHHSLFVKALNLEKNPLQIEEFEKTVGLDKITHLIPFFYKDSLLQLFEKAEHPMTLVIAHTEEIEGQERRYLREAKELHTSSFNHSKIMIPPTSYYFSLSSLLLSAPSKILLSPFSPWKNDADYEPFDVSTILQPFPSYQGKIELLAIDLEKWPGFQPYIVTHSEASKDKIQTIFPHIPLFVDSSLIQGFIDKQNKYLFVTEQDLFGKVSTLRKKMDLLKESSPIEHFSELSSGDFVVHIHHGIGIYRGIEKMPIMGTQKDYIQISYADDETLYTPIEQIFLVHKYMGSTDPVVNSLGGKKWEQKKQRVTQALEEMSEELVLLYETRKKKQGISFPADTPLQELFEREFPYKPTEGQLQAIEDIKRDMESSLVMDRLICGDVGYGKTEVAFRAIFKAVSAGKQVAFLAPTTPLVEQHYHTMKTRFSQFPIRIAMLSRSVSLKDQKKLYIELEEGSLDIVVGTHALLSKKIHFKNLGLLVIDEEQRFGVKHKEHLKEQHPLVDTLTLSATPIPRTLHMGLSSFRDMSLITTPPVSRLPIKTYVMPFSEEPLIAAVRREIERGGQVFMIHNRVRTISFFANFIQKLIPEARIGVGHAQMSTKDMEEIFLNFISHKTDILISTTIVENGIDIANANTIIIDKPELLGLGELYQLRGRVGRGQRQGYAFLFYDPLTGLTPETQQRLQTIEEHTTLGSGFQIAMRDLEIRGAGNLLGKAQSGLFNDIGMTLYSEILKKVVHKIQGKEEKDIEPLMDLPFDGHIPEHYVSDDRERFRFYKILMQAQSQEDLQQIQQNAVEVYGPIPVAMHNLLRVAEIKILARNLSIKEIRSRNHAFEIYFLSQPHINTHAIASFLSEGNARILNTSSLWIKQGLFAPDLLEDLLVFLKELSLEP